MLEIKGICSFKIKPLKFKLNLPNAFFFLFFMIDYIKSFGYLSLIISNILLVLIGGISISYVFIKKGLGKQMPIMIFIYFYTFFGIIGFLVNKNMDIQELFWPLAFMGMSMLLLNFSIDVKLTIFTYYFYILAMAVKIILHGDVSYIGLSASRNVIGIIVIQYFSFYAISLYKDKKNISIIPCILGLIVTVLGIGRSGVLSALLLMLFFVIFDFEGDTHRIKSFRKNFCVYITFVILSIIFYNFLGTNIVGTINNFKYRGLKSVRTEIWNDYILLVKSSVTSFLFGAPIKGTYLLDMFKDNLHNSFFMLHAKYGIFILITIVVLIISALRYFFKKKNYLYISLLLVVLFRMQFDYTNFNGHLDVTFFFLLFERFYESVYRKYLYTNNLNEAENAKLTKEVLC